MNNEEAKSRTEKRPEIAAQLNEPGIHVYPDGRVNTKGAAAYLGMSDKTLANHRWRGTGPRFIKRGRVFYFIDDLNAWLAMAHRVVSTAQARLAGSGGVAGRTVLGNT